MGYQNENARRCVFDLETAPLTNAIDYLTEAVAAPSTWKDPDKIAARVTAKRYEQLEDCSFDPDLCRIVAIGHWLEDEDGPTVAIARDETDETSLLARFWDLVRDRHLVGFNCCAFDAPVLLRRSLYLGVPTPLLQIDKYRHPGITDLQLVLSFNRVRRMHSLSFYAKRFGLAETDDTLTGADIHQAVIDERWDDITRHCLSDVVKTAGVAAKCGYFTSVPMGVF